MGRWLLVFLLVLSACGAPPERANHSPDAVASWNGGELSLETLESAFASSRSSLCRIARRQGGVEELLPCYRELAEDLAMERFVLAEFPDLDAALLALPTYSSLRNHAYLENHLKRQINESTVTDSEVEAALAEKDEPSVQPASLTLWNIFKRHQEEGETEATLAELATIRGRFLAGETWDQLAREVSDSETRLRGGLVGTVTEDRLPKRLSEVAFSLPAGDVSDPILVRGGAVILHVTNPSAPVGIDPSTQANRVRKELTDQRVREANAALIADREEPAGSERMTQQEVLEAVIEKDLERSAMKIADDELSVATLLRLSGVASSSTEWSEEESQRVTEGMNQWRDQQLLALELVETADAELRDRAEEQLLRVAKEVLVTDWIQESMKTLLKEDSETLQSYFEDNRPHYQTPLRFDMKILDLPFGDDPPEQLRLLELRVEQLSSGAVDLSQVSEEMGATVSDLGWVALDELPEDVPDKARQYLLQVGSTEYSVPYQEGEALHLIHVAGRQEPRTRELEEVESEVQADYLKRFERDLYEQISTERFERANFGFLEATVRRLLTQGETNAVSEPAADSEESVEISE